MPRRGRGPIACGVLLPALLAWAATALGADCAVPRRIEPADEVIAELRPRLVWSPVDGAGSYTLSLRSRVPEGRTIAAYDLSLKDNSFQPAASLATDFAKVTVSLSAHCAGGDSAVSTSWFIIDTTRSPTR